MIWILYVLGYLIGAYLTVNWGRSIILTHRYKKNLDSYKKYTYYEDTKEKYAELALAEAKRSFSHDMPFVVVYGGCFWPLFLLGILVYFIFKFLPSLQFLESKAEKEVSRLKTQKALTEARKAEWDNALKALKDAGIDTTELRKMKIE
jgi:hypothetical protein